MRRVWWVLVGLVGAAVVLSACHADGLTFVVDTTADTVDVVPGDGLCQDASGNCSLRAAVMEANATAGIDQIELAASATYTLSIPGTGEDGSATGDLDVTEQVVIVGNEATIDGGGIDRVLDVQTSGGTTELQSLTVSGGAAGQGAAIRHHQAGAGLTLIEVEVTANSATAGAPISVQNGSLTFLIGTVWNNTGTTSGAIANDAGTVTGHDLTVSGDTATAGGAMVTSNGGTTTLRYSTITQNTTTTAAVDNQASSVTLDGVAVAEQTSGSDCGGSITSAGANLDSDNSCGLTEPSDQPQTAPLLGALGDNGGVLPTHLPELDSPLIDAGTAGCSLGHDGRWVTRPQNTNCDVGAVEVRRFTVDTAGDTADASPGDGTCADAGGDCTLRAAVDETNALDGTDHVTVDPTVTAIDLTTATASDEDLNAGGDLDITDTLHLDGNGTTITQTIPGERVIYTQVAATITDATITGGTPTAPNTSQGGAGIRASNDLTLTRVTITGNDAVNATADGGGVLIPAFRDLHVEDSTIAGNTTGDKGGGIATQSTGSATATIVDSTISGNTAGSGGGIWSSSGTFDLSHATVTDNTGANLDGAAAGTFDLSGSIIADPAGGANCDAGPTYTSLGYNLSSNSECNLVAGGDLSATSPLLDPLADNGGPTETHLLALASPAVDAVPWGTAGLCDSTTPTDQRGNPRAAAHSCDMGATELNHFSVEGGDSSDANPGDGICHDAATDCTLRAAIDEANALPGPDYVTVEITVDLTQVATAEDLNAGGDLDVTDTLHLEAASGTITQTVAGERVVEAHAPLTITGGTLTGGSLTAGTTGGAGVRATADLTLTEVTVAGNAASGTDLDAGGVAITATQDLLVERSTISGNSADDKAGGLCLCGASGGGTATVVNSTISGNSATSGGGIWVNNGSLELVYDTIADNTDSNLDGVAGRTIDLSGTVVADAVGGDNCETGPTYTSGGYNLASDATCNLTGTGDQPSTDPLLGALADNGGPTLTHLPTGPTADIIPVGTSVLCDGTVAIDQRGVGRPFDDKCDVGSVER